MDPQIKVARTFHMEDVRLACRARDLIMLQETRVERNNAH